MTCHHPKLEPTGSYVRRRCKQARGGWIARELFYCRTCGAKLTANDLRREMAEARRK